MLRRSSTLLFRIILLLCATAVKAEDAKAVQQYFAHPVVEDQYGVIAPWYRGQNGQCDFRIRVAAETLKRYPWTEPGQAVVPAPHFLFNGNWTFADDGTITIDQTVRAAEQDHDNGDVGQRSACLLLGLTKYYGYTGDPAAIGIVTMTADYLLDYCQTPADHPWPFFVISCPTKGKKYGRANPHGFIQLDLSAWLGLAMLDAHKLTGNPRYWDAAKHWADLFGEHCNPHPGASPWNRYANPEDVPWKNNTQTGGVVMIMQFLDAVIHSGYTGKDDILVKSREAGETYLRDTLLPQWTRDTTFAYHYWDIEDIWTTCNLPCFACQYMMDHPEKFPNWRRDSRNIISIMFCRFGVNPASLGGVYSGAWAFPESCHCCDTSLQYPIMPCAVTMARYGRMADSAWATEIARRQSILATYDVLENGMVEDLIGGGAYVAKIWFNLAHPMPLTFVTDMLAWQPEWMGANRENHIVRSTTAIREVVYGKGSVRYSTSDAPSPCENVLRLSFTPTSVVADGKPLPWRENLSENGYAVKPLSNGDCIVTIRHDGCCQVLVEGDDPQEMVEDDQLQYEGEWTLEESPNASGGKLHVAEAAGAGMTFEFEGNQVRLIGHVDPNGGQADVYLDGVKQLCGIDFWCPQNRDQQVVLYKNGLAQGKHTLKIVAGGVNNPRSQGNRIYLDAVQWSAAQGEATTGEGGGPADPQRVVFGFTNRNDYLDSKGQSWRPATEFVLRLKDSSDLVPISLWCEPRINEVANTADPELYRYGVHGRDFTAYFTVDPKAVYHARIKLCQTAASNPPTQSATSIDIQGKNVASDVDVAATAGGLGKAVDLIYNDIRPQNGVVAIRFWNRFAGEASVQAIEIGPGPSEPGATPVPVSAPPGEAVPK